MTHCAKVRRCNAEGVSIWFKRKELVELTIDAPNKEESEDLHET